MGTIRSLSLFIRAIVCIPLYFRLAPILGPCTKPMKGPHLRAAVCSVCDGPVTDLYSIDFSPLKIQNLSQQDWLVDKSPR